MCSHYPDKDGRFEIKDVANPQRHPNALFPAFENALCPRVKELRERYKLDDIVAGETDEWKRILLLRHWIKSHMPINNAHPTKTRLETFAILDAALAGGEFHCSHHSIVQHAVLNSFGYVTRRLGCGAGMIDDGGHHGVNEVWVNQFSKWVLSDAKYDTHFEKDGIPLSALEIRDEVWKDQGKAVRLVLCPQCGQPDPKEGEARAATYRWCSWETSTAQFTSFPAESSSTLLMFDDELFRGNTWYRDGKPHWAYSTPYLMTTTRRDWIDWTPNVVDSQTEIMGDEASIKLSSFTPNFRSYQLKHGDSDWQDCGDRLTLPLQRSANQFAFRSMNLFNGAGPVHKIQVDWKETR